MNVSLPSSLKKYLPRYGTLMFHILFPLLVSLLFGSLLFSASVIGNLVTVLIAFGLDPLRAQFVAALIIVAGSAFTGAVWNQRKAGAIIGAAIVFSLTYLGGFVQLEMQPVRDSAGTLESLNAAALVHTCMLIEALALLCAFTGAAVGVALGGVLLAPFYHLAYVIWRRLMQRSNAETFPKKETEELRPSSFLNDLLSWLAASIMILLIVLASGSEGLFLYSPDIGLHVSAPVPANNGLPAHGSIVEDSVVSPALGGQKRSFFVYLPPSYDTPQGRAERYPTLYLLHGSPGRDVDWFAAGNANQSADMLIAQKKITEPILILPDGNGRPGETSEWGNSFDGRQNIETFVAVDLVHYVDSQYRTIPEPAFRGIGGLSMGGFGAMNIAVHHPDVFGFVISLGGYYTAEGSVWGNNAASIQTNSPQDSLPATRQAWNLHIFLGAATKDQPYYADTMRFTQMLQRLHIPYHLDVETGYHSWRIWQVQFFHALLWLHWG
ncbi:MAG TPA: alpha/beta hydrolase-fold protein [Ktedonobacteraceae bacterium]|nr:alpha/beta hydrolase-fold protein [Ktedonobacteraceae bacterium]